MLIMQRNKSNNNNGYYTYTKKSLMRLQNNYSACLNDQFRSGKCARKKEDFFLWKIEKN